MAFLRSQTDVDFGPQLRSKNLLLRLPQMSDYTSWAELRQQSRHELQPFEPKWAKDELSREAFRSRIRFYHRDFRESKGYPFFIFKAECLSLMGAITLSNVRRGVTQSASVGYWMGAPFQNNGFMTEALNSVVKFAVGTLGLHRVEAASLPNNISSMKVLEKCAFQREGLARQYHCINGQWQDHILYGFIEEDLN